jgi:hypothetical protein
MGLGWFVWLAIITMGMGMRIVPGRKFRLLLRMMRGLGMRMVQGMVLVKLPVTVCILAGLGSGFRGLGIIRLAIGPVSWRHRQ